VEPRKVGDTITSSLAYVWTVSVAEDEPRFEVLEDGMEDSPMHPGVSLDHLVIATSDWERSKAFYRRVLGTEVVELARGRVAYRFGDLQLNVFGPGSESSIVPATPVTAGNSDLCFVWPGSIAAAVAHLALCGVEIAQGPIEQDGRRGPGLSVYFYDPDGSLLELICYS
jgi:catechol 2,3-dioxygenase-like lactoylglutathione lyase family enzyme